MTAYAIARLTDVELGPDIVAYLRGIDATLAPYGGRFIIHGGAPDRLEGAWEGDLIAIVFPDRARAMGWYESDAYQALLPLRTRRSRGDVIIIEGVDADHRATDILAGLDVALAP